MRVTVLPLAATWGEPMRVLADVDARLAAGPPTDLVLLPEQALQGYVSPARDFDLTPYAEPLDGPTARACAAVAAARGVHLVAPLVLREGAALYNAMVCHDPRGERVFVYRKRHPWLPELWATAGAEPPLLVEIAGARVTIATCYDLHFLPDDARAQLEAADLLLFPSAWVERPDTRAAHLAELAREFRVHIANANWAPGVVRVPGQGGSCIVDREGRVAVCPSFCDRLDREIL